MVGRLVVNLELIKAGYAPINIKFRDRSLYINCFRDYEETGISDMFVEMTAKYQMEELESLISISSHENNKG